MAVTFDPHVRLKHLENYVRNIHLNLPLEEAKVQLLRCRLVGYQLASELTEEGYTKEYIDSLMADVYKTLKESKGGEVIDPYLDPCSSQYAILDELRSYSQRDLSEPFMRFLRAEFKKVFVPTLRLMTDLCKGENKYSWDEVKDQLQEIMILLKVEVNWEECEAHLKRYMDKISPLFLNQ
jgi:hypothetical protein